MRKFIIIAAILGVVGLVVAKNTHVGSYLSTWCKITGKQFTGSISPEFEIERLKGEIAKLDSDVDRLINKEAELKVDLTEYKNTLSKRVDALKQTRENVVAFAQAVRDNDKPFDFVNVKYTPVTANRKLAADFALFQSQEASVQSLKNLIAAKQQQYNALVNQRHKFVTQKQTYQANIEQLEADWATLKNESSTPVADFDTNRVAHIEEGLKNLKRKIDIEREKEVIKGSIPGFVTSPVEPAEPQIDPDVVLNAIQNSAQNEGVTVAAPKEE